MSDVASPPSVRRRALWSLVAQGLASINGLVAAIVAARVLTPVEFGYFAALITVALVFVGLIGALLAQPLLLCRGDAGRLTEQARSTLVVSMIFGCLAGLIVLAVSPFLGELRPGFWVLAASFPLLALSDAFRYVGTVLDRANLAALLDALRLALFVGIYAALYSGHSQDATSFAILWCGCSVAVGVLALILGDRMTRPARVNLRQFVTPKFLGYQFSLEYFIGIFGSAAPTLSLGWFVSVEAIGYLRGVSTLFGPLVVIASSAVLVLSPLLVARTVAQRTPMLVGMAALLNAATLVWMGVLLLIPDSIGRQLLGDVWAGSEDLILPAALQVVGLGILTTAQTGIRVARPRYSFMMNVSAVSWALVCFLVGVNLDGLNGAAWGFAVGAFGAAIIAVAIYIRVKDTPAEEA